MWLKPYLSSITCDCTHFKLRERVQISASGHADADQSGADFFRFRFQSVPILSVPIETESAPFKILHRAN